MSLILPTKKGGVVLPLLFLSHLFFLACFLWKRSAARRISRVEGLVTLPPSIPFFFDLTNLVMHGWVVALPLRVKLFDWLELWSIGVRSNSGGHFKL